MRRLPLSRSFGLSLCLFAIAFGSIAAGLGAESGTDTTAAAAEASAFDWRAFLAPFHTVTLHLPIGFVTIAVILEIYWFFRRSDALRQALGLVLWVSGFSAVIVTLLGFFRASDGGYEPEMLEHHEHFGVAVAAVTMVLALVHTVAFAGGKTRKGLATIYRLLLLADIGLLTIAGHGGGNLTHGSKYLVEGAPAWAKEWLAKREGEVAPDTGTASSAGTGEAKTGLYSTIIQPAFEKKCYSCHGPEKQKSDYRMDTAEGLFAAGDSELEPIVAGRPLESYLVEMITLPEDDDYAMPPEGKDRLTPEETLAIIQWIWEGAKIDG